MSYSRLNNNRKRQEKWSEHHEISYKRQKARPTGTSRRSAKLRHQVITKNHECNAQTVFGVFTDKVCGDLQLQEEDLEPYESRVARSLLINFNDRIIKSSTPKIFNEWKPAPDFEYYSREDVTRENRVECDY